MRLNRRTLFRTGTAAGLGLLSPHLALGADKTLTIALPNNPTTLDPIQISNHDAMAITNAVFENLLEVNLDGEPVPCLARAMPAISDDALTFTFDLRDDVVFQNGQKFTAEDVKYSYEYMLDPKNRSVRRTLFSPIERITIESPTRVVFRLKHPYRPWLQYMTKFMGIFPKGSREAAGDDAFKSAPANLGTGPGVFVEWQPDTQIVLRKNANYWRRGVPDWDRVVAKIVPEDATRLAYLMTGQAQIISAPPPRDFARLRTTPGIQTGSKVALGGMWFMQTNTRRAPFDDVNFRKAVSCAIDRKAIAQDVLYGLLDPTATPAPTATSYHNAKADEALGYNPARAKDHLARSKHASRPEFELLVPSIPYLFDAKDSAVVMQSQLAAVGITMKITLMEQPQILTRAIAGTQVACLLPLMAPSDPTFIIQICYTADQIMSKSSGYTSPALDAAIQESYRYTDSARLDPVLKRIQDILAEDCPNIWLGFVGVANAWRSEVTGFRPNTGLSMWLRDVKLG
ncbi:ABC transporter substrate-binding protein [Roseomonas nepalensis]|uniref:ABC transporter substrate-binding protein n=1 Tax=Muricoccus nepalensis TaxID=1854500 RepID=A0A502GBW7_9PROT|nr:ABC transporter substrate-binding protein [Roseomonas nepalensis]TPG58193.1 ABC transporter substrate-binding protein [Roseomonas nepalensis]